LTIRALYSGGTDEVISLYFHWDYFNEGWGDQNITGTYAIRVRSAAEVPLVAERVDDLFLNTSAPTKTETEKAFVLGFVSMMGNVRFLITSISSVVIFSILLVAANTMAMSIRERVREIGILKALGFRKAQVLGLLLSESVFLSLTGALLGSLAARILYDRLPMAQVTAGFIPRFHVTAGTLLLCAAVGIFVGFVSAGIPAWRASRRRVVDALGEVA
jgi:putative ABC transport system permease protein